MNFFIRLPAGFQLRVQGGQVQNDRLTAANGTTVLFYGVRSTGLSEADNESPDAHSDEPGENSGNDDDDVEAQDSSSSSANDDAQVRPRSRSPRRYGVCRVRSVLAYHREADPSATVASKFIPGITGFRACRCFLQDLGGAYALHRQTA